MLWTTHQISVSRQRPDPKICSIPSIWIPDRRGRKKTPHSVTKQRPGEGKNNLNQTATFLMRGTLAQPAPRKAAGRHPIPRGPEIEESKELQASQRSRKRGIEESRDRGIVESGDRGIEASDGVGAVEELKTSNGIPKART
jgi:hypothetical protein